ncbi:MAG TPA: hypothetical protein VFC86_13660, partial [Planctomycetota bacterium]|nr:hypothetical protein [Planctomycetota bacterium]
MKPRLALLSILLSALSVSGRQEEEETPRPKAAPRLLTVAATEESGAGILAWHDDDSIALATDRGERAFRWEDLRPYSAWRAKSILAGRDAAKRLHLAEFCREHKMHRQARWEFAAAKSLDPKVTIPDLEELRKLDAEAF